MKKDNRKNQTTTKLYQTVVLPQSLMDELRSLGLSKIALHKAILIVYKLGVNPFGDKKRTTFFDFTPLSKTFLVMLLGNHYYTTINTLKEANIIECDNIFHEGKAFCYRLNPKFAEDTNMEKVTFSYKVRQDLQTFLTNKEHLQEFKESLAQLQIPFKALSAKVDSILSEMTLKSFQLNNEAAWVEPNVVNVWGDKYELPHSKFMTFEMAKEIAFASDCDIIKDGSTIVIAKAEDYLTQKKAFVGQSYRTCIENLKDEKTLYASRNSTNLRLDTNFTSMPSVLFDIIIEHNGLAEIDVKNSQPALLAMMADKRGLEDNSFQEDAYAGILYEKLAEKMGVSRAEAKLATFEVLFSGYRCNSPQKKMFALAYPELWDFTVEFKKLYGDNALAIALQRLEASIFIGRIYTTLVKSKTLCFTKHDSVICKAEDFEAVMRLVKDVFEEVKFKGQVSTKIAA